MTGRRAASTARAWIALLAAGGCGAGEPAAIDAAAVDASLDAPADAAAAMVLTSPAFVDRGALPARYTCDDAGVSPPLAWSNAPPSTVEYALLMTTLAPDGLKWNWVLYRIPAGTGALLEATTVGVAGRTSDGPALAYAPPCSQGPGAKSYTFTLHALTRAPSLPPTPAQVTGAVLDDAVADRTAASASLTVTYTRPLAR